MQHARIDPSRDRCKGSCGLPPHYAHRAPTGQHSTVWPSPFTGSRISGSLPTKGSDSLPAPALLLGLTLTAGLLSRRAPSPLRAHDPLKAVLPSRRAPSPLRAHDPLKAGLPSLLGSPPSPSPHASGGCPLARARVEQSATAKGMGGWETLTGQPQQARATRLHTKARSATATRLAKVQQNPKDRHTQTHDSKARAARRAKTRCGADSLPASRTSSRTSSPRSEAYRAKNTNTRRTDSPKNANPNKARRRRRAGSSDLPGGTR